MADEKDGTHPLFYMRAVENKARSREEGRPIYEDVPYVKILMPGSKDYPDRKVRDEDKQRWPRAWAAFESGQENAQGGTPLERWNGLSSARLAELQALNIHTVDQLAEVPDGSLNKLGPDGRKLRDQAQAFIQSAGVSEEMAERVKNLEARIRDLEAENEELRKNQKAKPGPKPKEEAA